MSQYRSLDDSDLFSLFKQGHADAFSAIYQRYSAPLYQHGYSKLRDKEAVRDLIQDLFTNLWDKRAEISLSTSLSAYLYGAVRNRVLNIMARRQVEKRHLESLGDFVEHGQVMADHQVRERELRNQIEQAVASLPHKMREVFELSRNEHLTHKEIAERLAISDQTVNKQIKNALRVLRSKIGSLLLALLF